MRTDDFWQIVQRTQREGRSEPARLAALTCELQRLGEVSLRDFECQVRDEISALDTLALRDVASQLWVLSDEAWLNFRAWCVSQGERFLIELKLDSSQVLKRISQGRAGPFDPPNGELFIYCPEYARVARSRAVA